MNTIKRLFAYLTDPARTKKIFWTLGMLAIILFMWAYIRGCNSEQTLKSKVFLVGRDSTWYPLQILGKERYLQAFTDDLLLAIAKEEDLHFQTTEVGTTQLFSGLDIGNFDAILTPVVPNVLNQDYYLFSDPIYRLGPVLIVPKNSTADAMNDMEGKTVGLRTGFTTVFNLKHYPSILFVTYDNMNIALDNLANNRLDGVIVNALSAYSYTEGFYADKLKVVTSPLTTEGIRLVTLRHPLGELLIEAFNEGLKKVKKDGAYLQLLKNWNLTNTEVELEKPASTDTTHKP